MKRDIFRRGPRMTHYFGATEQRSDPLGTSTFTLESPHPAKVAGSAPQGVQQHGEYRFWGEPRSPVQKPNGNFASVQGPSPDLADQAGRPVPVGTKRRLGTFNKTSS